MGQQAVPVQIRVRYRARSGSNPSTSVGYILPGPTFPSCVTASLRLMYMCPVQQHLPPLGTQFAYAG